MCLYVHAIVYACMCVYMCTLARRPGDHCVWQRMRHGTACCGRSCHAARMCIHMCIDTRIDTCCPCAAHRWKALAKAVVMSAGTFASVRWTCRRRCRLRADISLEIIAFDDACAMARRVGGVPAMPRRGVCRGMRRGMRRGVCRGVCRGVYSEEEEEGEEEEAFTT